MRLSRLIVGLSLLIASQMAFPWSFDRSEKWEGYFQIHYQFEEKIEARDESYVKFNQDLGWGFGFGYNFNGHINASFNFNNTRANYNVKFDPNHSDAPDDFRHTSDYYAFQFNGQWNLLTTEFTPLLQFGIGSSNFDTNISNGRVYCTGYYYWWCYSDSYSSSGFTYNAGLGARWDYSRTGFLKLIYVREFVDLDIYDNPEFDTIQFQFGGKF